MTLASLLRLKLGELQARLAQADLAPSEAWGDLTLAPPIDGSTEVGRGRDLPAV